MKNFITVLLVMAAVQHQSAAQAPVASRVINSTGGSFKNNSYILEWNVGETALVNQLQSSAADGNYMFTNGLLQTFALFPKAVSKRFRDEDIRILPNPTPGNLQVNFQTPETGQMKMVLYDGAGQVLYTKEFISTGSFHTEKINMTGFSNGTYMLQISVNAGTDPGISTTGSYKIIKLQ